MSSYIKPQVLVFQEFRIVPTEITEPLRAHIAGPHAVLHRYSDRDEKADIRLGAYDRLADVCYPWPQRKAGSVVDLSYGKLFVDDALLKYFEHDLQSTTSHITAVDGKFNWIESDTLSFKANTSAYPRSSAFLDRDVKIGDVAYLRTVVDTDGACEEVELWTSVAGFASSPVDSLIKPAENDANNQPTTAFYCGVPNPGVGDDGQPDADNNYLQVAGKENCVKLLELDGAAYNGLVSGDIEEEYTIQVVKSTVSGCNAARLRVRSASGRDDADEVVPNDFGEWTSIGSRGLRVKFDVISDSACFDAAAANEVAYDAFVTGQKWVVAVAQEFYAADADSAADGTYTVQEDGDIAGAYAGEKNDVYIVEVTKGGEFDGVTAGTTAGFPEVTVRTVKGLDHSGPTEVAENGGEIGIGTNGVKVKLSVGAPLDRVEIENGGSTYTTATVSISAPDAAGGTQATATATVTGGAVSAITITNPGSGYYNPPTITVTGDGTGAVVQGYINAGLRKGDRFYVTVVASQAGPVRRLILRDDLPGEMRDTYVRASTVKSSVRVVADANITLSGLQTVDGVALAAGDRVLVVGQDAAEENGPYVVVDGGAWTRATDADTAAELVKNIYFPVTSGDTFAGSGWVLTNTGTVVVDTTPLNFVRDDAANTERYVPLDLKLYIKDNIQVSRVRPESPNLTNYWFEDTQICVQEGVTAYHPEWTSAGAEQPLPVESGTLYAEYREFLADLADEVNSISDVADLDQIAGQLHPDNPLKWGVYKALSNSNGTVVKYTAVSHPVEYHPENYRETGPDLDSWVQVLERIKGRDDMYNLVPMTFDRQVQNLWAAHIGGESNEIANNWKAGFFGLQAQAKQLLVGQGALIDGVLGNEMTDATLATLSDDPNATGTNQFTLLQVPSGSLGYFITNNVQPGDLVRYNYSIDQFGEEQYEEYVVDQVLSENSLLLFTSADAAVPVAQRFEIWHNRNRNEIADDIAQQAGSLSNRRVCAVWPDQVSEGGVSQPGYYLAAALAGLVSGVVPHQPLTNVEVAGFDDYSRSYRFFNETQLNRMAEAGVWIVTEDRDGTPHTRHALTTDNLDLNRREEMIRRNVDSMSYLFLRRLRPYIGRTNVQPGMIRRLRFEVESIINFLSNNGFTEELGSQLISGEVRKLAAHPLLRDRVEIVLDLVVPAPLNNIELHLVV